MSSKIIKHKRNLSKNTKEEKKKVSQDTESTLSQIYKIINDPRLKNIGSEFLEKLMYLYFIYLAQKGVGATFMAFDSLLLSGFKGITSLFSKKGEATDLDLDLTTIRYADPRPKEYTEEEKNNARNEIYEAWQNMPEETKQAIEEVRSRSDSPELSEYQESILGIAPSKPLRWSSHEEYETKPWLEQKPDGGDGLLQYHAKGGALNYAAIGAVGKEALKALLLASITAAVGATAVGQKHIYDKETTKAQKENMRLKQSEERAKNWLSEVKHEKQLNDILNEFNDLNTEDEGMISHFSGGKMSVLKKGVKPPNRKNKKNRKAAIINTIEEINAIPLTPKTKTIKDKIGDAIQYARDHNVAGNVLMVFINILFVWGSFMLLHDYAFTDENYKFISDIDYKKILSDIVTKNINISNVKDYVQSMFDSAGIPKVASEYSPYMFGDLFGLGLKKSKKKQSESKSDIQESRGHDKSFYEKRIKPIAKKVYDIATSDESITVAKALAQIAFIATTLYLMREAGHSMYDFMRNRTEEFDTSPTPEFPEGVPGSKRTRESLRHNDPKLFEKNLNLENIPMQKFYMTDEQLQTAFGDPGIKSAIYPSGTTSRSGESITVNPNPSKSLVIGNLKRLLLEKGANERVAEYLKKDKKKISDFLKNIVTKAKSIKKDDKDDPEKAAFVDLAKIFFAKLPKKAPIAQLEDYRDLHPSKEWLKTYEDIKEHIKPDKETGRTKKVELWKEEASGLKEDITEASKFTKKKLRTMAEKIYNTMKSDYGQAAMRGITATTILVGLTALLHSKRPVEAVQLSPEELKEQYMNSIGESVLF